MRRSLLLLAAFAADADFLRAVETKFWAQNEQPDFEKGTLEHLSLRSDGRLMLAPVFRELFDSSVPYLWSLAMDSRGNLYAGGGGPSSSQAKLFRIDGAGKTELWAEVPGMEVHAIAVDRKNNVYAATSPDGKIYKVTAKGKPELFYDPKAKYIWAIQFNGSGDLFVATGDSGEVHRVTPDGKGTVFFRTEDTHARSLAIDDRDNIIVGTEPGGLILRVSPKGEGFVLYQSGKREVTAVAVAPDGTVYAAAVGNKPAAHVTPAVLPLPATSVPPAQVQPRAPAGPHPPVTTAPPVPAPAPITGGSELYRIEKDNYARKVWSHAQDVVYAIAFDGEGRAIIGTGNKGHIYRLESDIVSTLLVNALPSQITAFARGGKGRLYAATGNIGKVYQLGPEVEKQGTFQSEPLDTETFAYWGRVRVAPRNILSAIRVETRSGNLDRPQENWSPWAPVDLAAASRVASPSARFLQYRLTLSALANGGSPELSEIEFAYMPKNIAPVVEQLEITPANYKFQAPALTLTPTQTISLPGLGAKKRATAPAKTDLASTASQSMQPAKGHIGARWLVRDGNDDDLIFKVEIRGVGETEWKLLREKVKERYVSWDSTAYPDGDYVLRVTASDSPGNTPEQALTSALIGDAFGIDNTPPVITALTGSRSGMKITARWKARDARSVLSKAEYSLNGGDWIIVEPTTRLTDSSEHDYVLNLESPGKGEITFAVRVTDEYDNQSVDKVVVR